MYYNVKLDSYDPLDTAGWRVASIPVITHATHNRDRYSIPNRDGDMLGVDMWRNNAYVTVTFHSRVGDNNWNSNFQGDTLDARYNRLLKLLVGKHHLHIKTKDIATPSTWDDAGYYEILDYTISSESRMQQDYMRVDVQFEVFPYKYFENALTPILNLTIENPYDDCMPYFLLAGTTGATISFSVNGYEFITKCPSTTDGVFVDTKLQMAVDASQDYGYLYNMTEMPATGDYEKLRFKAGTTNIITKGTNCRNVITYPRWGYKI